MAQCQRIIQRGRRAGQQCERQAVSESNTCSSCSRITSGGPPSRRTPPTVSVTLITPEEYAQLPEIVREDLTSDGIEILTSDRNRYFLPHSFESNIGNYRIVQNVSSFEEALPGASSSFKEAIRRAITEGRLIGMPSQVNPPM
jgi:hypothetical protein